MEFKFELDRKNIVTIKKSFWTGKISVYTNGREEKQLDIKGKPFLIRKANGSSVKMYVKNNMLDPVPRVTVKDKEIELVKKLPSYAYALSVLPLGLLFVGGFIGAILGFLGVAINFRLFRTQYKTPLKVLITVGVSVSSFVVYILFAYLIQIFL